MADTKTETKSTHSGSQDLIKTLVWSVLALVVIRSFIFESFKIPSSSMVPTLHIGDHIFVSKFDYGLNIPFTKLELVRWGQPKRGDVIVFLFPKDESLHYVKRVIGVPGDTIEIRGREIFVNNAKVSLEPVSDPKQVEEAYAGIQESGMLFQEKIDGRDHWVRFLPPERAGFIGMKQKETIPPDRFFVMGDNRDDSYDSRSWGFVARENIKGRARVIWLSIKPSDDWISPRTVTWSRTGKLIQ
ncbi:MAG: signal peptidase I [Proteobacteria bacterium]|nr:signal peptidase I [Pseudomonadota bacterium]